MVRLLNCFVCAILAVGVNMDNNIQKCLTSSQQALVIIDGKHSSIENMNELNIELDKMLLNSRLMPAFGVSIHTETLNAINSGVWLKLQYNGTQIINEMPFDELIIEVNPEFTGFNIIRGNKGIYEGRCYYVALDNSTMQPIYQFIIDSYTVN